MSEQMMWVIERQGVYAHGVCGVFFTLEAAKQAVEQHVLRSQGDTGYQGYAARDGDGYHAFSVEQRPVGVWTEQASARHIYLCRTGRAPHGEKARFEWKSEEIMVET